MYCRKSMAGLEEELACTQLKKQIVKVRIEARKANKRVARNDTYDKEDEESAVEMLRFMKRKVFYANPGVTIYEAVKGFMERDED